MKSSQAEEVVAQEQGGGAMHGDQEEVARMLDELNIQ